MIADMEVLVDVVTIAILFAFVMVCSSVMVARSVPPASDAASGATNPAGRNLLGMSACFGAAAMLLMNDAVVGGFLSLAGFVVFADLGLPFARMLVQQPYSSVADGKFEAPLFPHLPLAWMGFDIFNYDGPASVGGMGTISGVDDGWDAVLFHLLCLTQRAEDRIK